MPFVRISSISALKLRQIASGGRQSVSSRGDKSIDTDYATIRARWTREIVKTRHRWSRRVPQKRVFKKRVPKKRMLHKRAYYLEKQSNPLLSIGRIISPKERNFSLAALKPSLKRWAAWNWIELQCAADTRPVDTGVWAARCLHTRRVKIEIAHVNIDKQLLTRLNNSVC